MRDNGGALTELEGRLSTLMGSTAIKPQAGSLGAQFYPFAFQIVPPVTGELSNGKIVKTGDADLGVQLEKTGYSNIV